jgi:aminoglycoside phosphotransferase family enzyme
MRAETHLARVPVTLVDKVRFLSESGSYRECPVAVELRETHMSYVFLTPAAVYKLKKPITNAYVDFRTLDARGANCRIEVQLNRRLAPHVYLGVVPLTQSCAGNLALEGDGEVVEWLVHMERLPAARMLDHLILHNLLLPADVAAVGRRLGEFFAVQPAVEIGVDRHVGQLRRQLEISTRLLARPQFALPPATLAAVHSALSRYLDDGVELAVRVRARRIVEGHGDLRPEHVCLLTPPVIIDCLEFSRDLRLVDPFDEIAFLDLECARLGAPWVGTLLRHTIEQRLQDHAPARLIAFYTALRACIRAHLAAAHLLEREPRTPAKWLPLARGYLARAAQACAELG